MSITCESLLKDAKEDIESGGDFTPKVFALGEDGQWTMMVMIFGDDEEKVKIRDSIRKLINTINCTKYIVVMDAWMKIIDKQKPEPSIRPGRWVDRKECIIITEYNKDMTGRTMGITYERKGDIIVFKDEFSKNILGEGYWNFFLEKKGLEERMSKVWKKMDDEYIRSISKDFVKKNKHKLKQPGGYDPEQLIKDILAHADEHKKKLDKQLYEEEVENEHTR